MFKNFFSPRTFLRLYSFSSYMNLSFSSVHYELFRNPVLAKKYDEENCPIKYSEFIKVLHEYFNSILLYIDDLADKYVLNKFNEILELMNYKDNVIENGSSYIQQKMWTVYIEYLDGIYSGQIVPNYKFMYSFSDLCKSNGFRFGMLSQDDKMVLGYNDFQWSVNFKNPNTDSKFTNAFKISISSTKSSELINVKLYRIDSNTDKVISEIFSLNLSENRVVDIFEVKMDKVIKFAGQYMTWCLLDVLIGLFRGVPDDFECLNYIKQQKEEIASSYSRETNLLMLNGF